MVNPLSLSLAISADITKLSSNDAPVYQKIVSALKAQIDGGELVAGELLPSSRDLSISLGISRPTIAKAYRVLASQGYIQMHRGKGTFVLRQLKRTGSATTFEAPINLSMSAQLIESIPAHLIAQASDMEAPARLGPPLQLLPISIWKHLASRYSASSTEAHDAAGHAGLRSAMAQYLRRARGIAARCEDIILYSDYRQALAAILRAIVEPGDFVVLQEPGSLLAKVICRSLGATIITFDRGTEPSACLKHLNEAPRLILIRSSHQLPTGSPLSIQERSGLVEWCNQRGIYILEDDCDHQIRFSKQPAPPMMQLTSGLDWIVYLTDFVRLLYPLSTISATLASPRLASILRKDKELSAPFDMNLREQLTMMDMLDNGFLERRATKIMSCYAARLAACVRALTDALGSRVMIEREPGSTSILFNLSCARSDLEIQQIARSLGLAIYSTAPFYSGKAPVGEFVLSFAHQSEVELHSRMVRFGHCLKEAGATLDFAPVNENVELDVGRSLQIPNQAFQPD